MEAAARSDLPLLGVDYVEFYVGNARQAARFWQNLGFVPTAYRGLETGSRHEASWCLESGEARFVFTSPLSADSAVAEHVRRHGDGVKDVALRVKDAREAYELALARGAEGVDQPQTAAAGAVAVTRASFKMCGPAVHSLVSRDDDAPFALPGYEPAAATEPLAPQVIQGVDHLAIAVHAGDLTAQIEFYQRILGFAQMDLTKLGTIETDYSALMSKVMEDGTGKVKFPIVEPSKGPRRSQVDEFLLFHDAPGIQHIGLVTDDIVTAGDTLRAGGVEFLPSFDGYYDLARERVPAIADRLDGLERNSVLADCDEDGYLLQAFSRPLQDRPTFFLEVIERRGSRGFGPNNVKALFQALEREQAARGNL